jgi:hypothetical protein
MAPLLLRFKKKADAGAVLTCERADGSWTSASIGPQGGYGPVHDLAHYVVESAFGLTGGFLGLIARGWDIADFEVGAKEKIGQQPDVRDAQVAECMAGLLSGELMGGRRSPVDEFNWTIAGMMGTDAPTLSAEELAAFRNHLDALRSQWDALEPGQTLELAFEPGTAVQP